MTDLHEFPVPRARPLKRLLDLFGPLLALIAIYCLFGFAVEGGTFWSARTVRNISTQTVVVALSAMGMTLIMISGGIDLSVGSIIALACVVVAYLVNQGKAPVWAAAAAGIGVGGLCGLANGAMVATLRIVPFIVTLGTLGIYRGLALMVAKEQTINTPATWLNTLMYRAPHPAWLILSPGVWLAIALALAMLAVLRLTVFGVHVFAVGSSEETARLCGLRVGRIKILVYTLGGLLAGLSGLMQYSYLSVGDPTTAQGYELDVIAAVVIGGGSLSGGVGSIAGTIIGALIMTTLRNGGTMMGWPNYLQMIIVGAIIIVAVTLDRLRHRAR
ncbi:MAG: ABC transporter permease [Candidatus Sumerlaeota bacterium]|nr:ABC transporter permease [Candidatus Sumerlaeota bacterium]